MRQGVIIGGLLKGIAKVIINHNIAFCVLFPFQIQHFQYSRRRNVIQGVVLSERNPVLAYHGFKAAGILWCGHNWSRLSSGKCLAFD